MAAYRGLSDIMFLLLENRGDVNARDHQVRVSIRMFSLECVTIKHIVSVLYI